MTESLSLNLTLRSEDLERFVATFTRDDTFTLLYILTRSESPRALEELSRRYGAPLADIKDRLERLLHLGLVTRKGHTYEAAPRATIAMRLLEERSKGRQLPAVGTTAAIDASVRQYVVPITNNSTWSPVRVDTVAGTVPNEGAQPLSQPRNEEAPRAVARQVTEPNAPRSQHYLR